MLNLSNVLQLVIHCLYYSPLSEKQFVESGVIAGRKRRYCWAKAALLLGESGVIAGRKRCYCWAKAVVLLGESIDIADMRVS